MNSPETNIYGDQRFRDVDVGEIMRVGHVDIAEGDRHIVNVVRQHRAALGRPLRIFDIGSGSAHLCVLLAKALPDCEIIANEIEATPLAQARAKLRSHANSRVFDRPFDLWTEQVDVLVSWGSHHHMSHGYLPRSQQLLARDGLFLIGDEFCPEYIPPQIRARLDAADSIVLEGGYIFDNELDLQRFRAEKIVPEWSVSLERERRRALWKWYKFVCDCAIEKDEWLVAISELQIARDDLITDFSGEHKTSSYLLERELRLSGYRIVERKSIGERDPALQSFAIFSCQPGLPVALP